MNKYRRLFIGQQYEVLENAREKAYESLVGAAKAEFYKEKNYSQVLALTIAYVAVIYMEEMSAPDSNSDGYFTQQVLESLMRGSAIEALAEVNMLAPKGHLPSWKIPPNRTFAGIDGFHREETKD